MAILAGGVKVLVDGGDRRRAEVQVVGEQVDVAIVLLVPNGDDSQQVIAFCPGLPGEADDAVLQNVAISRHGPFLDDLVNSVFLEPRDEVDAPGGEKSRIDLANCWAHARRKFVDCEQDYPLECKAAIDMIRELYAVESQSLDPWSVCDEDRDDVFGSIAKLPFERFPKRKAVIEARLWWGVRKHCSS